MSKNELNDAVSDFCLIMEIAFFRNESDEKWLLCLLHDIIKLGDEALSQFFTALTRTESPPIEVRQFVGSGFADLLLLTLSYCS